MQLQHYQTYLIFAVFVASGISFLKGGFPRVFVRITVAAVGVIGFLLITGSLLWGIAFAAGFGARSLGQDGPMMLGGALAALYFAVCALTCLPIIPRQHLRTFGLWLHFVYMPITVYLATLSGFAIPWDLEMVRFSFGLSSELIYAMLWFRMVEMEKTGE